MKERPILFNGAMVRALIDGTKTQTRRPYKLRFHPDFGCEISACELVREPQHVIDRICPYGQPGDQLWVRETTEIDTDTSDYVELSRYSADGEPVLVSGTVALWDYPRSSRPSIHMPRWASRILLEVVSVRVERLQDISEADCWAEGIEACDGLLDDIKIIDAAKRMGRSFEDAAPTYAALWESINGPGSWNANPWVWVIEFRRIAPTTPDGD